MSELVPVNPHTCDEPGSLSACPACGATEAQAAVGFDQTMGGRDDPAFSSPNHSPTSSPALGIGQSAWAGTAYHACGGDPARRSDCWACTAQRHQPYPAQVIPVAPVQAILVAKTPGIAVLLTFLWLGAGHLYANKTGTGIALICLEACLGLLALTGFGLIIAIPVWAVATPLAMIFAAGATRDYNRRHGIRS